MKRIAALLAVAFLCAISASAQQDTVKQITAKQDTVKPPWKHTLVTALTLTQVSFTDWSQGGENALSYAFTAQGQSAQDLERTNWTTSYNFAFGQARLADQGLRKTDDKIDIASILTYKMGTLINPYAGATLKTQFAKGYKYDATGTSTEVSAFFDPAYLTQSAGIGIQASPEVKTRLGAGLREIITSKFTSYAGGEKTQVEGGLESVTEVAWKIDDNMLFAAKLELFDPFKAMDVVVVRSDNTLSAKVSKYVVVNFNVQLINEKQISPRTQVKETLAFGISYTVL